LNVTAKGISEIGAWNLGWSPLFTVHGDSPSEEPPAQADATGHSVVSPFYKHVFFIFKDLENHSRALVIGNGLELRFGCFVCSQPQLEAHSGKIRFTFGRCYRIPDADSSVASPLEQ
jgi:hypothetical protein